MKLTFATSEVRLDEPERERLRAELKPIEALVASESSAHLHVVAARERRGGHRVSMSLDLPKRFLFATEAHRTLSSAFRLACESLVRKLGTYRERRERSRARHRPAPEASAPLVDAASRGDFDAFKANIAEHHDRLRSFIRWELHHDPRATPPVRTRISVEDVADWVLADLFARYQKEPPPLPAEQWMVRRALERLDARIRESLLEPREQQQEARVELECEVPEEYLDEYDKLQDTFPDLYGAGEPTPLDRLVDKRSEPDREMEREELSGAVADALGDLPRDWRRTLSLHFLEGFAPTEIADLLETSEDQVRQDLESSLAFLRARLK